MNDCVSIDCIFDIKLRRGLCVGVSKTAKPDGKDVIRLCWVTQKPSPNIKCTTKMQAQMIPSEAIRVGVALIRSSILGESLLRKLDSAHVEAFHKTMEKMEKTENTMEKKEKWEAMPKWKEEN